MNHQDTKPTKALARGQNKSRLRGVAISAEIHTVSISVKFSGGTYLANADGIRASCTMGELHAVKRVVIKYATCHDIKGVLSIAPSGEGRYTATWTNKQTLTIGKS